MVPNTRIWTVSKVGQRPTTCSGRNKTDDKRPNTACEAIWSKKMVNTAYDQKKWPLRVKAIVIKKFWSYGFTGTYILLDLVRWSESPQRFWSHPITFIPRMPRPRSSDILQGLYCLHGILGRISGHRLRCHHGVQPWSWNRLWKVCAQQKNVRFIKKNFFLHIVSWGWLRFHIHPSRSR